MTVQAIPIARIALSSYRGMTPFSRAQAVPAQYPADGKMKSQGMVK
jgi:hypothetical protein